MPEFLSLGEPGAKQLSFLGGVWVVRGETQGLTQAWQELYWAMPPTPCPLI
jgi:hypothetical protein